MWVLSEVQCTGKQHFDSKNEKFLFCSPSVPFGPLFQNFIPLVRLGHIRMPLLALHSFIPVFHWPVKSSESIPVMEHMTKKIIKCSYKREILYFPISILCVNVYGP